MKIFYVFLSLFLSMCAPQHAVAQSIPSTPDENYPPRQTSRDYMTLFVDENNPPVVYVEYENVIFLTPPSPEIVMFNTPQGNIVFSIEHGSGNKPEYIKVIDWPDGYVSLVDDFELPDDTTVTFTFIPWKGV